MFGVSNPPKSVDSSVEDPETILEMLVLAKLLFIPRVPFNLTIDPTDGGYTDVVPRALDILPILISVPVAGIVVPVDGVIDIIISFSPRVLQLV